MKQSTPLVSVIVPNYNHERYLRQRIESVLQQTYDNIEVILLDDCSTDESVALLESYANHPRVQQVVVNRQNSGSTFVQWRRGLTYAAGKYVWIAESDDWAEPTFLATLVDELESNPDAVMAFSGSVMIDAEDQPLAMDWDKFSRSATKTEVYDFKEMMQRHMMFNNGVYNASMVVWRRDAVPELDDRLVSMRLCGDWLFWSRLAKKGKAIQVMEKLNRFRQHAAKVTDAGGREGRFFTEGLTVLCENADALELNSLQRKVIAGRVLKRLSKFPHAEALLQIQGKQIFKDLEQLSPGSVKNRRKLVWLYELNKYLNFAKLTR